MIYRTSKKLVTCAVGIALACASMACSNEYTFDLVTERHGSTITDELVTIPVGNAIGVVPLENGDAFDEGTFVELESAAPAIMEVEATGDPTEFVLWGVSAGRADVEVFVDGDLAGFIEVEVSPREP